MRGERGMMAICVDFFLLFRSYNVIYCCKFRWSDARDLTCIKRNVYIHTQTDACARLHTPCSRAYDTDDDETPIGQVTL